MTTVLAPSILEEALPAPLRKLQNPQTAIPRIAADQGMTAQIDEVVRSLPTSHALHLADSRHIEFVRDESVHLVLTSPPYWTLKEYNVSDGQLGHVADYEEFLAELDAVWRHSFVHPAIHALVPEAGAGAPLRWCLSSGVGQGGRSGRQLQRAV